MKIVSFSPFGYEGAMVIVEVDLRRGIPSCDVVGLADCAVKEARFSIKPNKIFFFDAEGNRLYPEG